MAFHADAFCSYYLSDIDEAAKSAECAVMGFTGGGNIGELAQAHTGLGNCLLVMCRLEEAREAYLRALALAKRMGDDCRSSIVLSNLGASYFLEGDMDSALEYGHESLALGKSAPAQPGLLRTWSNLASAYVVRRELDRARECFESWQQWMRNGRSWAARMEYWCDTALMEVTMGNTSEALKLVATAERESQGREDLVVNQGRLERLRVFLAYHTSGVEAAKLLAKASVRQFQGRNLLAYMEALAALGWLETRVEGGHSQATQVLLQLLKDHRLQGKRMLFEVEGFLGQS
jgi:tetratricopeptide (TPR) repeat protein